jgi:hypothetical protein
LQKHLKKSLEGKINSLDYQRYLKKQQQRLNNDSTNYPKPIPPPPPPKKAVAIALTQSIENNHTLRQRVLSALKTGGIQALGQMLNHPAASFAIAALEDWQKSQN